MRVRFWSLSFDWRCPFLFLHFLLIALILYLLTYVRYGNAFSSEIIIAERRKQCAPLIQINFIQIENAQKRNIIRSLALSLSLIRSLSRHLKITFACASYDDFECRWMNERAQKISSNKLENWNSNKIRLSSGKKHTIENGRKKRMNERNWLQQTYAKEIHRIIRMEQKKRQRQRRRRTNENIKITNFCIFIEI